MNIFSLRRMKHHNSSYGVYMGLRGLKVRGEYAQGMPIST